MLGVATDRDLPGGCFTLGLGPALCTDKIRNQIMATVALEGSEQTAIACTQYCLYHGRLQGPTPNNMRCTLKHAREDEQNKNLLGW